MAYFYDKALLLWCCRIFEQEEQKKQIGRLYNLLKTQQVAGQSMGLLLCISEKTFPSDGRKRLFARKNKRQFKLPFYYIFFYKCPSSAKEI